MTQVPTEDVDYALNILRTVGFTYFLNEGFEENWASNKKILSMHNGVIVPVAFIEWYDDPEAGVQIMPGQFTGARRFRWQQATPIYIEPDQELDRPLLEQLIDYGSQQGVGGLPMGVILNPDREDQLCRIVDQVFDIQFGKLLKVLDGEIRSYTYPSQTLPILGTE